MCQCGFLNCKQRTILVKKVMCDWRRWIYENSVPSAQFAVNLKLLEKIQYFLSNAKEGKKNKYKQKEQIKVTK